MTPWEREHMELFVRAERKYRAVRDEYIKAAQAVDSVVRGSTPIVVRVDEKTFVVRRDEDSQVVVEAAEV